MNEEKGQLVINKLESKAIYDYLVDSHQIGNKELYFIINDDLSEISSVGFDATNKKFYYEDMDGNKTDIVTVTVLKNSLGLHTVATSGSYNDLGNQPRINNVTLSGNKTTSDLGISYNDLSNQPTIPQLVSTYSSSDETKAITGKGVASALSNYVPRTTTVTGTGALDGGGALSTNRTITHKLAPNGLTTSAVKIGVDSYGHVQVGAAITASDINAQSTNYTALPSADNMDVGDNNTVVIIGQGNENLYFSSLPPLGTKLRIYYVNITNNQIQLTIDPTQFNSNYVFLNENLLQNSHTLEVEQNQNSYIEIIRMESSISGSPETFTFIDILQRRN